MTPKDIEWRDPPPTSGYSTRNRVAEFVAILKTRPGKWAIYPHAMTKNGVKHATWENAKRYPGTEWARSDLTLYGRWVGE